MTTRLTKPVRRLSEEYRRDRSKMRRVVITIYPSGYIGLRLEKTRREETLPILAAYDTAVKMRVADERATRERLRKEKRRGRR